MSKKLAATISEILAKKFENTPYFVTDVEVSALFKIEVFIDTDVNFIGIDTCVAVSRFLENELEKDKLVPETYTLEVSSPGIDAPLKQARHFLKYLNKPIELYTIEGVHIIANLLSYTTSNLELQPISTAKKTKNKSAAPVTTLHPPVVIEHSHIKEVKPYIDFGSYPSE